MEDGTIARLDGSNRANFSCNPGFILASPSNESELRCIDRHWTPQTPLCLEETSPTTNKGFEDVHRVKKSFQVSPRCYSGVAIYIYIYASVLYFPAWCGSVINIGKINHKYYNGKIITKY